jgi:hypothetical protein
VVIQIFVECVGCFGFMVGEAEFHSILIQLNSISFKFFGTVKICHGISSYDAELLILAIVTMKYRYKEAAVIPRFMFLSR